MNEADQELRSRFITLASVGFALGMILGVFITAVTATGTTADGSLHICAPEFEEYIGDPLKAFILEAVITGIYGAIGMGGSAVYRIESWSILKATVVHFSFTVTVYYIVSFYLRWISPYAYKDILIMLILFIIPYFLIWISKYLSYRAQIKDINAGLDRLKSIFS